jgi:cell division protein FtsI (penicillin-binding protein 3)
VKQNQAKNGTVIVMDPATGDILAMADYPSFDPNRFAQAAPDTIRNRAVTDAYEPGSVNKVVTAAAALEEGAIKVNQTLMVPDFYRLYTKTFHDAHTHAPELMTLADILAYSSNIGAIKVAKLLGPNRLYAYLRRFGLTETTGLGFPGESSGILPPTKQWSGTSMGTIPIGQGIAVTPLQMAAVYATIANGGLWVKPRLVAATVGPDGVRHDVPPSPSRRVVSEETSAMVSKMLAYAVDVGTGVAAQIPGYWVAGKTGTARKVNEAGTGYLVGKYVASFIGYVPASRPALVIAAVLDEPVSVYGGVAAAPLFRDVARFALGRLQIAPAAKLRVPPHAVKAAQ